MLKIKFLSFLILFPFFVLNAQNKTIEVDGVTSATIEWNKQKGLKNVSVNNSELEIVYPFNESVFPSDFSPASFMWKSVDSTITKWDVTFKVNGKVFEEVTDTTYYKPDNILWEKLKEVSEQKIIVFTIKGNRNKKASVTFSFSKDAVEAPIFYRAIPLPFSHANTYQNHLKWYLGDVSRNETRLMLDDMPVCANCHSFTKDGTTFAMDVDYANNKGNFCITSIEKKSRIEVEDIISWSDYKREDNQKTFGLLAQLSPDGKFAISTIKDQSIFVPVDDNFWYSQLFFPIKGILVSYDIENNVYKALPGASNENYVQSSPTWEPEMKELIFARSKIAVIEGLENETNVVVDIKYAADFINRKKDFKFDLYRVPWNNSNGGEAVPIAGASHNNKSNYFAKYSPDGKWLVFCQAENFMLLQPDSRLYIMPASGDGEPRPMNCNLEEMNSWHSFSPNGKWMVFSSKHFGPYTQLFLTHIDENGNDTPPIWLEQLTIDKKAANIPEFVNVDFDEWLGIEDGFTKSDKYLTNIVDKNLSKGNYNVADEVADDEIKKNPENYYGYYIKARTLVKTAPTAINQKEHTLLINSNFEKCIELLNRDIQNGKTDAETYSHLAASYFFTHNTSKSYEYSIKTLELDPDNLLAWEALAEIYFERQNMPKTIEANMKLFGLKKVPDYANICAQIKLMNGDVNEAINYAEKALELDNCYEWTLEILGNCYVTLEDYEQAEKYYNDLVNCSPTSAIAYLNRGKFYYFQKEISKAIEDLNQSVKYDSKNWIPRYFRATLYKEQKKYDSALEDANAAIKINNNNSDLYMIKATCLFELGEYKNAIDSANKAKDLIYKSKVSDTKSFNNLIEINRITKASKQKL
jgi:tetratricopeptide (TPR) repeat protein